MSKIAETAYGLLGDDPILPIDIENIVASKRINLVSHDFGDEISGILLVENGEATIGYNKNEHRVRNRFTIAHELGHYILGHYLEQNDVFIDKSFSVLLRSNQPGEPNTIKLEREANEFAACLLMPEKLLRIQLLNIDLDYTDDTVKLLAKKFDVSTTAMSFRLSNLQLLGGNY